MIIDESAAVPMDELLSANPDGLNNPLSVDRKNSSVKINIMPSQVKTLSHLPKRPPVDIAFTDLVYTVSEGTTKSKTIILNVFNK